MWRYQVNDSTWTWTSGSNTDNKNGIYGEKASAKRNYLPAARKDAVGWYESTRQELWIVGGYGYDLAHNYFGGSFTLFSIYTFIL